MANDIPNTPIPLPGPAVHGVAITPGAAMFSPTRAVWVGTSGSVTCLFSGDTVPVTLAGVPAGTMLDISVVQVTGATTAGSLVGLS